MVVRRHRHTDTRLTLVKAHTTLLLTYSLNQPAQRQLFNC